MYKPTQVDVGAIAPNPVGNTLLDFSDRQAKLYANQSDRAIQAQKIAMEQNRFAREQELNKRQDLEYNREIGLRDMRKNLAAEYEANPYADVWGGGAANKILDKQVLDYVNSGKEITPEMATKLQGLYETNRPFKEDLSQVFRSKLLAAGEDPAKADAYAKSMTDSMPFSRATLQAQLDKQQEIQQKVYDANADARLEALKLNKDADKLNANNATEILKSRISNGFGGMGGGTGGGSKGTAPGGYSNLTADELSLSWMPAFTRMGDEKETQDIINGLQAKSVPSGIAQKALDESVVTKNGDRYVDKNLLKTNVDRYMGIYSQTGAGGTGATTVNADVNPKDLLTQFAPRQIAGYNPEGMLERAKTAVPELFPQTTASNNNLSAPSSSTNVGYKEAVKGTEAPNYEAVNKTSGAMGQYQFLNSTLNDYRDKLGGFTNEEFLKNPKLQDKVFEEYTKDNEAFLKAKNVEVNDWTRWLSHNLGIGNVKPFLEGKMTDGVKKAIAANLPGKEATIDNYIDKYASRFSATDLTPITGPENVDPIATKNRSTDYFKAQDRMSPSEKSLLLGYVDSNDVDKANSLVQTVLNRGSKPVADTITGSDVAPSAPVPVIDRNGNLIDTSNNLTSGPSIFSDVGGSIRHAYDRLKGDKDVSPAKAGLATANAIAGDTLNILGSPYTAMKYGTDSLMGYRHKPSVFQNMASSSHDTAVKELSKVTSYPEEVLFATELAAPLGSKKVTAPISKLFSSLSREPELLPSTAKSDGIVNRVIDSIKSEAEYPAKISGIGKEAELRDVIRKEAIIKAEADKFKNAIKPSTSAINEGRELLKSKLENRVNTKINAKVDGKEFANNYWNRLVEDRASGKITDEELFKNMRELRDGGYISTRDLMEALDSIGIQVK